MTRPIPFLDVRGMAAEVRTEVDASWMDLLERRLRVSVPATSTRDTEACAIAPREEDPLTAMSVARTRGSGGGTP